MVDGHSIAYSPGSREHLYAPLPYACHVDYPVIERLRAGTHGFRFGSADSSLSYSARLLFLLFSEMRRGHPCRRSRRGWTSLEAAASPAPGVRCVPRSQRPRCPTRRIRPPCRSLLLPPRRAASPSPTSDSVQRRLLPCRQPSPVSPAAGSPPPPLPGAAASPACGRCRCCLPGRPLFLAISVARVSFHCLFLYMAKKHCK